MSAFNSGGDSSYGPPFRPEGYDRGAEDDGNRDRSLTAFPSTRTHGHTQHFTNFPLGSSNIFGSAMPQTSSPTSYGPDIRHPTHNYTTPQFRNITSHPIQLPQRDVEQSQYWIRPIPLPLRHDSDPESARIQMRNDYHRDYLSTSGANHSSSSLSSHNSSESRPDNSSVDSLRHQETIESVRRLYNIPDGVPVNLHAIPDPPPGQRPAEKQAKLVHLAIAGSPNLKLSLREIYSAIEERFSYYRDLPEKKWQGSIRHMLSLKAEFVWSPRPVTEPGQGQYWSLDMRMTGDKRVRKRRRGRRTESIDSPNEDEAETDPASPPESHDSISSWGAGRGSSTTGSTSSTSSRHQNRSSPYIANETLPRTSPFSSTSREKLCRSESDTNLPSNFGLMSITGGGGSRSLTRANAMYPPPRTSYADNRSAQHGHHKDLPRQIAYNNPNSPSYYPSRTTSFGIQRPSFPLPPLDSYPPIPSPPVFTPSNAPTYPPGPSSSAASPASSRSSNDQMAVDQPTQTIFSSSAQDSSGSSPRNASANFQSEDQVI